MPQGRIILKAICESRKLAALRSDGARLLYSWLIPNLDVNGCFSGDPTVIKGQVFTRLRKSVRTVQSYLLDLEEHGLIIRYTSDGDTYLHVPNFREKQPDLRPEREGKPRIPVPTPEQLRSKSRTSKVKESKVKISKDSSNRCTGNVNVYEPATTTAAIVSAWKKLPLPPEKKQIAAADLLAIDRAISELHDDLREPIHEGMILEAIQNYDTALSLPHSQTFKHKLYPWLTRHVKKYVTYNFDLEHHDASKFERKTTSKLPVIRGHNCDYKGCRLPAVWQTVNEMGFDVYRCPNHMPEEVRKEYGLST